MATIIIVMESYPFIHLFRRFSVVANCHGVFVNPPYTDGGSSCRS